MASIENEYEQLFIPKMESKSGTPKNSLPKESYISMDLEAIEKELFAMSDDDSSLIEESSKFKFDK